MQSTQFIHGDSQSVPIHVHVYPDQLNTRWARTCSLEKPLEGGRKINDDVRLTIYIPHLLIQVTYDEVQ